MIFENISKTSYIALNRLILRFSTNHLSFVFTLKIEIGFIKWFSKTPVWDTIILPFSVDCNGTRWKDVDAEVLANFIISIIGIIIVASMIVFAFCYQAQVTPQAPNVEKTNHESNYLFSNKQTITLWLHNLSIILWYVHRFSSLSFSLCSFNHILSNNIKWNIQ